MANIAITSDAWTEISITSGTIQNISATADIELSAEQVNNSGVVLKPSEIYQWDNETIYARAVTEDTGALRVVNFKKAAGGGGGYVLPVASASTLGGVKVGNNLTIDPDTGVLDATGGGGGYVLPPATASTLGGVIIGDNVTVDANGEISVAAPYSLPPATASTLGGVIVGDNISVDANGEISTHAPYSLPAATSSTLGGVKIGDNITVDANGEISTHAPYTLPAATASTLGGVKIGDNITVDANGEISVAAPYSLPKAAAGTLGGVKIGSNVNVDSDGVISVAAPYTLPAATNSTLGGVSIGANISVDGNGEISTHAPYSLPTAAAGTLGGVKVGNGLYIDASGVLSTTGSGGNPVGTIISFMGATAPSGYLICDGTVYNIADYQLLANHITTQFGAVDFFGGDGVSTFAVPDLRGEFLRGAGTNSHTNQGSGSNVGTHQDSTQFYNYRTQGTGEFRIQPGPANAVSNEDSSIATVGFRLLSGSASSTVNEGSFVSSRPTNTSVLYCIKYTSAEGNDYSTTERVIGTWIDGKPLYQITIVDTMPTVTTNGTRVTKGIDVNSLSIENCVDIGGYAFGQTGNELEWVPMNCCQNSAGNLYVFCQYYSNSPNDLIFIASSYKATSNQPCYITLKYTKTTD